MHGRSATKQILVSSSLCRVLFCAAIAGSSTQAVFAGSVFDSIAQEVRVVFEKSRDAVVKIEAVDDNGALAGTGFFIDPNGTLYTSYTIGGESNDITVIRGERKYPATRLLGDPRSGIAILKVEAETPFLRMGKSEALTIAAPVITIGYPMDLPLSPNFGVVGGFDVKYLGRYFSSVHIRANVPVQRGEGGAPLLNSSGEVVGVLISGLENGTGCFALPIEAAEKVRKDYMRFGDAHPGWIGINVGEAAQKQPDSRAEVQELMPGTPATNCGLQKGDIVLQIGEKKVKAPEDVLNASFYLTAGDDVSVVVRRGTETISRTIRAAMHPQGPAPLQARAPDGMLLRSTP